MIKIKGRTNRLKIKKMIRILGCFLLLVVLGLGLYSVDAGSMDSTIVKNRKEGVYAVTNINGEDHLYYLNMYTMNGRVAYCIELGVDINTEVYNSTSDFSVSNLSAKDIEYIRAISYLGYQYPGHEHYKYYMAAQELIWEYLSGVKIEWTNVMDVNGARINIDNHKREILALRDEYFYNMNLDWHDGQALQLGSEVIVTDSKRVMYTYEVVSSGHSKAEIVGNQLKINVDTDYVGEDKIILKKKEKYSYSSDLYYYNGSQKLISNGNFNPRMYTLNFVVEGAKLDIQVVDYDTKEAISRGDAKLDGAKYKLYSSDEEFIQEFSIDNKGQASISGLECGDYYVEQESPSVGYQKNDDRVSFTVDVGDNKLVLEEKVISNTISVVKFYGRDGDKELDVEEGVSFSIYDSRGNLYDKLVTDDKGEANIDLPYGKYLFKQDNTIYGYSKVEDFEVVVEEVKEEVVRYNLIDSYIECGVQIVTRDRDSNKEIKLAGFQYKIKEKKTDKYLKYNGDEVFYTDDSGKLILPIKLGYGDYILEQVGVPKGYILNDNLLEFSLGEHTEFQVVNGEIVLVIDYYNQLILGKVNVVTDREVFYVIENGYKYRKDIRDSVKVGLFVKDNIVVNGEIIYQSGDIIYEDITNDNGRLVIEGLYLGNYCVVDSEENIQSCFELTINRNDIYVVDKDVYLTVSLEKGDIVIDNVSDLGHGIDGSVVELYDKDDKLIYTGTTLEGSLKVIGVPKGEYCFKQRSVPKGYVINADKVCFSYEDISQVMRVQLINNRTSNGWINVPNTFSEGNIFTSILLVGLFSLGVFIYYKKVIKIKCN